MSLGEKKWVKARIKETYLVDHRIILEEYETIVDQQIILKNTKRLDLRSAG